MFRILLIVSALVALPAQAQQPPRRTAPAAAAAAGSAYAVGGIKVDVAAKDPESARFAAFRIAQRQAWPQLWSRLTGNPVGAAPKLSDGQLDSVVAGIESQGERFSTTRYIATLGVVFDRSRVTDFIGTAGGAVQSPPMLLLKKVRTPWLAAWGRFRENVTPSDYVLAPGGAVDKVLPTPGQLVRPWRSSCRTILTRHATGDVLVAEARVRRTWPGGPIAVRFAARHGPDAEQLGSFELRADGEDGLNAMLDEGVRRIDALYSTALQTGRLRAEAGLAVDLEPIIAQAPFLDGSMMAGALSNDAVINGTEIAVITPDAAALAAFETLLRQTEGVTAVTATSLSLGGTSRLLVSHFGTLEMLQEALAARGLGLSIEGGRTVLRRLPGGVPPPTAPGPTEPGVPASPG
ncbi:heavy-metal-associated domain-containing protein, partial [Polymorphobacter multimanifer]|uniref:heavy-metal-associated domain-containing protein n=1 Tax=Polymorphobacter multimanifer TaxID=1070431 RepID=UPI001667338A